MPLAAGQTLAFYELLGPLGAGAMGEVWRARDTRLEREVAVKVLPDEVADDEERLQRFEREAKTLASVNHPNVAQIFGVDRAEDTYFIAMELVPGEDLAERLARGALSVAETLDVGRQIAAGVEAAHEAGVIHRDLKPANVRISPDGTVKVLDFGLAKADGVGGPEGSGTTTEDGRLLGTPTYMAPEQARGLTVDKRVDVWALGCVLHECLTGRPAFPGETVSDVLAAVLEREPDESALPPSTPARLRELVQRCLRKDPRVRLRDVGEARIQLEELASGALASGAPQEEPGRGVSRLVPALAAVAVGAIAGAVWMALRTGAESVPRVTTVSNLTRTPVWSTGVNWSPRGELIAYSEMTERGTDVFVKPAAGGEPELVFGLEGSEAAPRFSPDGRTLAFVSSSWPGTPLCLIEVGGTGEPRRLVNTGIPRLGGTAMGYALGDRPWHASGRRILFSRSHAPGGLAIHRVDVETGEVEQVTFPAPGEADYWATYSFDGRRIAFHRMSNGNGDLWILPAEGGEPEPLLTDETGTIVPAWRPDDRHLVFSRTSRGGYYDLWEIDAVTRRLRQITFETRRVWSASVAADDRIAFCSTDHDTFLHEVARSGDGTLARLNAHTGDNFGARPAPQGERVAYHSNRTGNPELWLLDRADGSEVQLTDNPAADLYPDWSPDGTQLVFASDQNGPVQLFLLDVERRTRQLLIDKPLSVHGSNLLNATVLARWSPDARDPRIAFIVVDEGGYALWTVRPDRGELRETLSDVYGFDWYLDSKRGLVTRQREDHETDLLAVHLETGESRVLATLPHTELEVAPDGTAVSFCAGVGHIGMDLYVLELDPPDTPDGLPTARGEPVKRTEGGGRWHAHNGGWTPDSQRMVFTLDADRGDVFELVETREP